MIQKQEKNTGKPNRTLAEYLLASPAAVESLIQQVGTITPFPDYLVISPCNLLEEIEVDAKAILCLGIAEQIRNLVALIHFRAQDIFFRVIMPFGPACASLIAYAGGIMELTPKEVAFIGPVDPTHNRYFPPDCLGLAIPMQIASQMVEDLDQSFLAKRPNVAFPNRENNR